MSFYLHTIKMAECILATKGPKGDTGAQGPQGPQGSKASGVAKLITVTTPRLEYDTSTAGIQEAFSYTTLPFTPSVFGVCRQGMDNYWILANYESGAMIAFGYGNSSVNISFQVRYYSSTKIAGVTWGNAAYNGTTATVLIIG